MTLRPRKLAGASALFLLVGIAFAQASAPAPAAPAPDAFVRHYASITDFHLDVPMPLPALPKRLSAVDFKNFNYLLFLPSRDEGRSIPAPVQVPVQNGSYGDDDSASPVFDVVSTQVVKVPHVPGGERAIVVGDRYENGGSQRCTGVVQLFAMVAGRLVLTDELTYDCRGTVGAHYNPKKKRLTVLSAHYAAGDRPCCPTLADRLRLRLDRPLLKSGSLDISH